MKHPIIENVEILLGKAGDYLETRVDLIKLSATGKTADIPPATVLKTIWG